MKRAVTSFPGGCSIGERPIDLHLTALDALGARVEEDGEELLVTANELTGADIYFPFPSVGATENALMAAVLADGVTVIHGAAREPEIEELCLFFTEEFDGFGKLPADVQQSTMNDYADQGIGLMMD